MIHAALYLVSPRFMSSIRLLMFTANLDVSPLYRCVLLLMCVCYIFLLVIKTVCTLSSKVSPYRVILMSVYSFVRLSLLAVR